MAAIMTVHTVNTASQFAIDHADMGVISCATGLSILVAPHSKRSQPPNVAAQMPAVVHGCVRTRSREDAVKFASASVGELSKETVSASDIAGDPVIVDLQVVCTGNGDRLARRNGKRMPLDLGRSTALPLNRLDLG
jgi:hypothetical protein